MTQTEIFNLHYTEACKQQKGLILLGDYRPRRIGFFRKIKVKKAINTFEKALAIFPDHFQSLFFIGKLYQRVGDYEKSLQYLETALGIEKENPNLPQEASLVAMHLNQIEKGIAYSKEALNRSPDHIAILGNHAMNLLIGNFLTEAQEIIERALKLDPSDKINQQIKIKIDNVLSSKPPVPTFEQSLNM
jgi:tetratricopeptide (TPR) repeat protein